MAFWVALGTMALMGLAEWLHARRARRVARLAFGLEACPRRWTVVVPWLRVLCCGLLAWGFLILLQSDPQVVPTEDFVPAGGYRHLLLALDVSPSMQLEDAGPDGTQSRARRAGEVMSSLLDRIATDQVRISLVAFYTGAQPVVVETYDLNVVMNCLDDLPLDLAFEVGQTKLLEGVRESLALAKGWATDSATLILVSDGDTLPDRGMPELPRSIARSLVVGVGDTRVGSFIDGHQSRQDAFTLRQLARRLGGDYFDANRKHLPSDLVTGLSRVFPLQAVRERGLREAALICVGIGSCLLAAIPLALALAGSRWQAGTGFGKGATPSRRPVVSRESTPDSMTYA